MYRISYQKLSPNDITIPSCTQYTSDGKCLYSTNTVTLSDGRSYTFTDAEFHRCSNSGYGGAIDQKNGGNLIITRCIFDTCSSGDRGGAVSFQSAGVFLQEDNFYFSCSSGTSGALDSMDSHAYPTHTHRYCKYVSNHAVFFAHGSIEYSKKAVLDSNIYVNGRANGRGNLWAGTVVNYHEQGPILYLNCLFSDGKGCNGGGLSFLGSANTDTASLSVHFCFFINNFDLDGGTYEIYFAHQAASCARKELVLHSFTGTPNSRVYIENNANPIQNWLPATQRDNKY